MQSDFCRTDESIDQQRSDVLFFFSSRRRHTRFDCDWSSDVCSSDLAHAPREEWLYPALFQDLIEAGLDLLLGLEFPLPQPGRDLVQFGGGFRQLLVEIGRASCRGRG